jgi:hypothetical protein
VLGYRIQNYFCVAKHVTTVEQGRGRSEERIFKTKLSRFIGLNNVEKIHVLFETLDFFGAISMCVLGCTAAQAILIYEFVVTSEILYQQMECSVMCLDVGVFSFWSPCRT